MDAHRIETLPSDSIIIHCPGDPMDEHEFKRRLMIGLSKVGFKIFNNPVGKRNLEPDRDKPPRIISFGLQPGSGDMIGWFPLPCPRKRQTANGEEFWYGTIAVFVSIETKGIKGKVRPDQHHWLEVVNEQGGFACVVTQGKENPAKEEFDEIAEEIRRECLRKFGLEHMLSITPQEVGPSFHSTESKGEHAVADSQAARAQGSTPEPDTD
jgi:hypothetical protein